MSKTKRLNNVFRYIESTISPSAPWQAENGYGIVISYIDDGQGPRLHLRIPEEPDFTATFKSKMAYTREENHKHDDRKDIEDLIEIELFCMMDLVCARVDMLLYTLTDSEERMCALGIILKELGWSE